MSDELAFEFKAASLDDAGVFEGVASPFGGSPDRVGDIVAPGAFARSLAEHKARGTMPGLFIAHNHQAIAGTWEAIEETAAGLRVKGRFALGTPDGDRAYRLAKTKAATGLSIGFRTRAASRLSGGYRRLDDIDLIEISVLATPAAPSAGITSVKTATLKGTNMATEDTTTDAADDAPVTDRVTKLEGAVSDLDKRLKAVEDNGTKAVKGIEEIKTVLRRPGAAASTTDGDAGGTVERKAFEAYMRGGSAGMEFTEVKTLRTADDPSAGYLAPPEFIAEVDKNIVLWSPIRQFATVRGTARGTVELPKRIGRPTATWVEELEDREDTTETATRYGKSSYEVKELTAYVDVSFSTLEDAAVDIFAELAADLAEEFGAAEGSAFVTGNGIKKPMGFMSDASIATVASGHASQVTADGLIDLFHALPSPYRSNAVWGMNSATLGACRKLKTTAGEYLLSMTGLAGSPVTTILGRPVVELPDMPDVGAGNLPVVFGDFAHGYRVFDRVGFALLRDDLTQRTKGKCRFHARKRVAGGVRKTEALRKLRIAAS